MTISAEGGGLKTHANKLLVIAMFGGGLIGLLLAVKGITGFLFIHEGRGDFIPDAPTAQLVQPPSSGAAVAPTAPTEQQQALSQFSAAAGYYRTQASLVGQQLRTGRVELWLDRAREMSRNSPAMYPTEGHFLLEQLGAWSVAVQASTRYQQQPNATTAEVWQQQLAVANQGAPADAQMVMPTIEALRTDADTSTNFRQTQENLLDVLQALQEWSNAANQTAPRARTGEIATQNYNASVTAVTQSAWRLLNQTPPTSTQGGTPNAN